MEIGAGFIGILLLLCCVLNCQCQSSWIPDNCSASCKCSIKEWAEPYPPFQTLQVNTVDCSGKGLTSLPTIPNDTVVLILDDNRLWNLSHVLHALSDHHSLQDLSLSHNGISAAKITVGIKNLRRITLDDNTIDEFTTSFFEWFPNLSELSLQRNKIKSILNTSSKSMDSMRSLRLESNDIIQLEWIRNLTNFYSLNILSLGGNHMFNEILPNNIFDVFPNLSVLIMADMNIAGASSGTFNGLHNLQSLDMDTNKFSQIPKEALSQLPNLRHFTMKRNLIYEVGRQTFCNMSVIETIELSNQPFLQFVDHLAFNNLSDLQTLYLSNNPRLSYIAGNSFRNCPKLETLDIQHTMIEIVSQEIPKSLPALRKIYLKNNPVNCNCMMMWIKEWIPALDKGSDLGTENMIVCSSPPQFRGNYLNDVSVGETNCAPTVEPTFPLHTEIKQGEKLLLNCRPLGIPEPQIFWILPSGVTLRNNSEALKEGYSFDEYGTLETTKPEEGQYTCVANNSQGRAERQVWVKTIATSSTNVPGDPTTRLSSTTKFISLTKDSYLSTTANTVTSTIQPTESITINSTLPPDVLQETTDEKKTLSTTSITVTEAVPVLATNPPFLSSKSETQTSYHQEVQLPVPSIEILKLLPTSALITWTSYEGVKDTKNLDNLVMTITLEHNNQMIYNDKVQPFGVLPDWEIQTPEYNISLLEPDQTYKICLSVKCCGSNSENHSCINLHTKKANVIERKSPSLIISVILCVVILILGGCFVVFYGKSCFIFRCLPMPGNTRQYQSLGLNEPSSQKHIIPMSELYPPLMDSYMNDMKSAKPTDCLIDTQTSAVYT